MFAYGADEPVILELRDGRIWMVIRTQVGRHYESFSNDGVIWSNPQPTHFMASDSPGGIARLSDGQIVFVWNNCMRFPYALGGRHVIHAAISKDDGSSWQGYREVFRDPLRNKPVPEKGDFGTAYPYLSVTAEGKVLLITGQGKGRVAAVLIDPNWLEEATQQDNFSGGMRQWTYFGMCRFEGVPYPDADNGVVLWIRKVDEAWPATAVWNFPAGIKASLQIKILLKRNIIGMNVGLTDHYSVPFDREDILYSVFNFPIGPEGELPDGEIAKTECWHILQFDWNLEKRKCTLLMDSRVVAVLPQLRQSVGICYLRLTCLTEKTDKTGFLVDSVKCDVAK